MLGAAILGDLRITKTSAEQASDQRERQHDRQDEPDPVTHGSPLPARGLPVAVARYQEPALQRGVLLRVCSHHRPVRRAVARGLAAGETGYIRHGTVRTGAAARPRPAARACHRPASPLSAPLLRSRHRLRCRPRCHDRPSDRSAQPGLTLPPVSAGTSQALAWLRSGPDWGQPPLASHAERSQPPGKTGAPRRSAARPGARNQSRSSRSIRPTRSKTLAAVRLSADNDLGKQASR